MYNWLMLGFVVVVVVGVSVYRHYKGDEESCCCCCCCCGDGGTTDYDDDGTLNIRPEIIEMCKLKYWEYDGSIRTMLFGPYNLFKVIYLGNKWETNSELNCFLTTEECDYISGIVGNMAKQIEFENFVELLDVDKDAQIN